jgi:hypothetical protein
MGMDLYGINPVLNSVEPKIDINTATEEEKNEYLKLQDKFHSENPGAYFRANIWAWRPIAEIIVHVSNIYGLKFEDDILENLHHNSGQGLKNSEDCLKLADAIESFLNSDFQDAEIIAVNYGWYEHQVVYESGHVGYRSTSDDLTNKISNQMEGILFMNDNEFEIDGFKYRVPHSVSIEHVNEFITFLRNCNGFEIW